MNQVFRQFRYPTSPESTAQADPGQAALAAAERGTQRLIVDKGNLR